ncbi:50S ribosomal protein L34 [Loktanella sp. 3ANDIMAR09]|uniref:YceD family protein n=1 Tax=Loktanella sp. 3ANDIMAR09 TaxID=1225657 RepID=UPI000701C70A|nr:DUF177 domain-containing protein [Loktanella sp. 3ANDIMAR09]KQI68659.1 50S ribosomal protein L34 [Loktanella sp. 3ANDIMAR09]
MSSDPALPAQIMRLSDLRNRSATSFEVVPTPTQRDAIAASLGIIGVKKLTFAGQIAPLGQTDWRLTARLGATVVQACVATLAPVTTRLDEDVSRTYAADFAYPEGAETEMPEDDTVEPLPQSIDVAALMIEELSLALPPFPRAPGAEVGQVLAAEDGVTPLTDEDTKPFAGLGALRDKLAKGQDNGE